MNDYASIEVHTRAQWRLWLSDHHAAASGVWVITNKQSASPPGISYNDLVEEGVCFGWVDSRNKSIDSERTSFLFTPRRPMSNWNASNKERAARMDAAGRMTPAGLEAVRVAKENGAWNFLDEIEALVIPEDLQQAFDENPGSQAWFDSQAPGKKRQLLLGIKEAKQEKTRQKRIESVISQL